MAVSRTDLDYIKIKLNEIVERNVESNKYQSINTVTSGLLGASGRHIDNVGQTYQYLASNFPEDEKIREMKSRFDESRSDASFFSERDLEEIRAHMEQIYLRSVVQKELTELLELRSISDKDIDDQYKIYDILLEKMDVSDKVLKEIVLEGFYGNHGKRYALTADSVLAIRKHIASVQSKEKKFEASEKPTLDRVNTFLSESVQAKSVVHPKRNEVKTEAQPSQEQPQPTAPLEIINNDVPPGLEPIEEESSSETKPDETDLDSSNSPIGIAATSSRPPSSLSADIDSDSPVSPYSPKTQLRTSPPGSPSPLRSSSPFGSRPSSPSEGDSKPTFSGDSPELASLDGEEKKVIIIELDPPAPTPLSGDSPDVTPSEVKSPETLDEKNPSILPPVSLGLGDGTLEISLKPVGSPELTPLPPIDPPPPPPDSPLGDGGAPPPSSPPLEPPAPAPIPRSPDDGKPAPGDSPVPAPIPPRSPDGKPGPGDPPTPAPSPPPGPPAPVPSPGPEDPPPMERGPDAPPLTEAKRFRAHIPTPPPRSRLRTPPSPIAPTPEEKTSAATAIDLSAFRDDHLIKSRFDIAHDYLEQLEEAAENAADKNALNQLNKGITATEKLKDRFKKEVKSLDLLVDEAKKNYEAAAKVLDDAKKRSQDEKNKVLQIRKARSQLRNVEAKITRSSGESINISYPDKATGEMKSHFVTSLNQLKNAKKDLEKNTNIFDGKLDLEGKHTKLFHKIEKEVKIAQHHLAARQNELKQATEAKAWRKDAIDALAPIENSLKDIKSLPRDKHIPVFSRVLEKDKDTVNKTKDEFDTWKGDIEGQLGNPSAASLSVVMHGGSALTTPVRSIERKTDEAENYRAFPPNPSDLKRSDIVYSEHQWNKDSASGDYQSHELTVYDLPKEISRRGILLEFLSKEYKNIVHREANPTEGWVEGKAVNSAALEKMIFTYLPPAPTEKDIMQFLEEKVRVGSRLTSNSSILNNFINHYSTANTEVYSKWNSVVMPNEKVFRAAKQIVDTLINGSPKSSRYIDIDVINDKQLAIAIHIVVEINAKEIKERHGKQFRVPEKFPKATPEQIKAATGDERYVYFDKSGKEKRAVAQIIRSTKDYIPENMENLPPTLKRR